MDTSRQILRWSIPGWLFVFVFAGFCIITLRAIGKIHLYEMLIQFPSPKIGIEGTVIVAAAGIPLGFIIYQLYYFLYGKVLFFNIVNIDRGHEIFSKIPSQGLSRIKKEIGLKPSMLNMVEQVHLKFPLPFVTLHRLKKKYRNKESRKEYENALVLNWEIVRYYLSCICINIGKPEIQKEFVILSDIYHSIGASRVAISVAWFLCCSYILLKVSFYYIFAKDCVWVENIWRTIVGLILVTFIYIGLLTVLSSTRKKALTSSQCFLKHAYYAYFSNHFCTIKK